MNIGKLNRRIEFLKKVKGYDDYGEPNENWSIFKSVWASKTPILGKEYFEALTTDTKVEVKFNCRHIRGIDNTMRIRLRDELYEIISVIDVKDAHAELLLYCRLVK